jgi:hypothetical protein
MHPVLTDPGVVDAVLAVLEWVIATANAGESA